jgi:hypothetical protein
MYLEAGSSVVSFCLVYQPAGFSLLGHMGRAELSDPSAMVVGELG